MRNSDPAAGDVTTAEHFHRVEVQEQLTPAEEAERRDEAELALLDEMAARFGARGLGAREAMQYARDALAVFQARDRAVCGGAALAGGERGELEALRMEVAAQKETMAQIWAWPDARKGVGAWFLAKGLPLLGCISMRKLAELRGCTVEDVSNVVDELQRINGWPKNAFQKSEGANESYRRSNGAK